MLKARNIDVTLIKAFLSVVESGSITEASVILNLTQGAVSQQIMRLEELFDTKLFDRSERQMTLTTDGDRLIIDARRILRANEETWRHMSQKEQTREICLGVPQDLVSGFIPPLLRSLRHSHPDVRIVLTSSSTDELLELLNKQELDMSLTTESQPGSATEHLYTDALIWVGAKHGIASEQQPLPVALSPTQTSFRKSVVDAMNAAELRWTGVCQKGGIEAVMAILLADMAVAPFLSRTVPPGLVRVGNEATLPTLPDYHVNFRRSNKSEINDPVIQDIAAYIEHMFSSYSGR